MISQYFTQTAATPAVVPKRLVAGRTVTTRTAFGCLCEAQTHIRAADEPHCTVTAKGVEGMPLATTTSWLGPGSWFAGTSK